MLTCCKCGAEVDVPPNAAPHALPSGTSPQDATMQPACHKCWVYHNFLTSPEMQKLAEIHFRGFPDR